MVDPGWLKPALVLPALTVASKPELISAVAKAVAAAAGVPAAVVETAFGEAMRGESFSIGNGVAIPHTELVSLKETFVCLAAIEKPLPIRTIDGRPPDVFLFILSKPDPQDHLLLLAHLARLTQSRTFLDGVRRARSADEVVALVRAAELRHVPARPHADAEAHTLVFVSLSGEKLVDALLIDLVDQGFGEACVLEAQSLREAAAREVPLFAGFRDLFGDPGGRRVLMLEVPAERADVVLSSVKRIAAEYAAKDARVWFLPVQTHWASEPEPLKDTPGGH